MPTPITIIQLISGETLQNVMPILALRPSRVISVFSQETDAFLKRKDDIENAVADHIGNPPLQPDFSRTISLDSISPDILKTKEAIKKVINSVTGFTIINYTGGTKEMGIGAWLAAKENQLPSIYCDSPREFRSGGTGEVKFPVQLPELARRLDVSTILAAQGLMFDRDWKHLGASPDQIEFGKTAFSMGLKHPDESMALRDIIRKHGFGIHDKPKNDDLIRSLNKPLPLIENDVNRPFLSAASKAGLIHRTNRKWFLSFPNKGTQKHMLKRLTSVVTRLDGGAFEGYVHSCLERSARFTQFLHGVVPSGYAEGPGFGETDFLAYEPEKTSLALITCKSSPPSLEHLESVLARKEKLGGKFARGILCIMAANERRSEVIRNQAKLLGLECVIGSEIESSFQCTPSRDNSSPNAIKEMEQALNSALEDILGHPRPCQLSAAGIKHKP